MPQARRLRAGPPVARAGAPVRGLHAGVSRAGVRGRKQPVKSFLLDQRRIAGLGNIYADESLFLAGIDPRREAGGLTQAECKKLAAAIQRILRDGLADGGTTFRNYRNGEGGYGHHQEHLCVYHRAGKPCPTCGRPIEKITIGAAARISVRIVSTER